MTKWRKSKYSKRIPLPRNGDRTNGSRSSAQSRQEMSKREMGIRGRIRREKSREKTRGRREERRGGRAVQRMVVLLSNAQAKWNGNGIATIVVDHERRWL